MIGGQGKVVAMRPRLPGWKGMSLLGVLLLVLLLVVANAHLVHVALVSQPDCVPHLKNVGGSGTYRAARSSC